jgi:hypothetical protein
LPPLYTNNLLQNKQNTSNPVMELQQTYLCKLKEFDSETS